MLSELLLPSGGGHELHEVTIESEVITLTASSLRPAATCPDCHQPCSREHSRYWRTPADLPCSGRRVRLHLLVRRFFCDNALCGRKTFAERFPDVIAPYARRTNRLSAKQQRIGLALGGEPGAQTFTEMAMPVSGDTVLRLIRRTADKSIPTARVLGIDDWAWCKGQRYGTILVDLERHCPFDLLPDRSADTVAAWLRAHPGVEIISCDRALDYIKGIDQGAPNATQVADRWHLLRNLQDVLIRIPEQNRACPYAAAREPEDEPKPEPTPEISATGETTEPAPLTKAEQRSQAARERRLARHQAVMDLRKQGTKIRAIARQLGMSRDTVRRYIKANSFPETAKRRKRQSILDPYSSYLKQRWAEGCHNGLQLYREIRKQGYQGSRPLVSCWAAKMRQKEPKPMPSHKMSAKTKSRVRRPWSPRYAVWLLLKQPEALSSQKRAALERMLDASPALRRVYSFAQAFIRIVRHRLSKALRPWLNAVTENKIPELSSFARSLERDKNAVSAALSLPWSNGQVEGQVNRLKLIKRQKYGPANFDLLRLRVLAYSGP